MPQTTLIQIRIDEDIKRKADALFADLGFDTPTAIRIFLNQSIRREGMPFEVAKPKLKSDFERYPKSYNSFREIINEIDEEIASEESADV